MRKVVIGLLVAALCLSLFGCVMGDGYGKYANIYKLLDAGDYEGAHAAINALAGIVPTSEPTIPTTVSATPGATVPPTTAAPTEPTTEPAVTTEPAETTVPPTTAQTEPPATTEPAETTAPPTTAPTEPKPTDAPEVTYALNTNTMKIHYLTCSSVMTIKEGNLAYTNLSREELIAQGYTPCGRCKP